MHYSSAQLLLLTDTFCSLLLVEPAHRKVAAGSLSLSGEPMSLSSLAGAGGSCGMEWLEVAAAPNLTT